MNSRQGGQGTGEGPRVSPRHQGEEGAPGREGRDPLPRLTGHEGPPRGSGQTAGSLRAGRRGAGRASSAEPVGSTYFSGGHRPCTSHHPHRSHIFAPGGVMAPDEGGNGTAPRFREAATKWGRGTFSEETPPEGKRGSIRNPRCRPLYRSVPGLPQPLPLSERLPKRASVMKGFCVPGDTVRRFMWVTPPPSTTYKAGAAGTSIFQMVRLRPGGVNSLACGHKAGGDGAVVPDSAACPESRRLLPVADPGPAASWAVFLHSSPFFYLSLFPSARPAFSRKHHSLLTRDVGLVGGLTALAAPSEGKGFCPLQQYLNLTNTS